MVQVSSILAHLSFHAATQINEEMCGSGQYGENPMNSAGMAEMSSRLSKSAAISMSVSRKSPKTVKRTSPDTAIHEQNGNAKVYDDKYTFKTNVDNDNSDTTYTDKHKYNMRKV